MGITGAMRAAPMAAIEVLLTSPLHLQLKAEARAGIYILYCSDQWKLKAEGFGYAHINQGMKDGD
jgi:hypothetical protein